MLDSNDPIKYEHECVTVNDADITAEFMRVSSDLATWSHRRVDAQNAEAHAKLHKDEVRARACGTERAHLENTRGKATVADIDAAVTLSPEVHAAEEMLIEASTALGHVRAVCDAVMTKRDMLISLGAQLRAEMAGDPTIREYQRGRRLTDANQ